MKTWNERFGFLICAGLALLVTPAAAQNPTGTIFGIVSDTSGGALAGVEITIHNVDTGLERRSMTNEMGEYRVPLLPAGTYEATAVFPGFKTAVRSDLHLNIQATLRTDLVLQLGEVKETVKVTGQAPLLETETSASGHVIDNKQIENLPLNVRQFMQLAYLVPFSTPASRDYRSTETPRGTPVPAGAGARPEENNYQIDGIDNKESGRNNFSVTPPMD
ncbi:MAG TPA: carboxypeptidase-like regulatory domain-containing protein, partial [Bryobacteraceae bacterium]|nr:carboxypeptidase-like regulatory domain-containing protein [Bryobacteraceae bacterium]